MALEFGFGLYEHDPAIRKMWAEKFAALSADDQKFYDSTLCYLLMLTDIGVVTKETIPHIVARAYLVSESKMFEMFHSYEYLEEYLHGFIGYAANVLTLDTGAFIRNKMEQWRNRLPSMTKKQAEETRYRDIALVEALPADKLLEFTGREWRHEKAEKLFAKRLAAGA